MSMTDANEIALAVVLVVLLTATAFALGVFFRRLTDAGQPMLPENLTAVGPIGFVHFESR